MTRRVVVLGGSGGIGHAIVQELVARGHEVTSVNRGGDAPGPEGIDRRAADLRDVTATRAAVIGADVVVMAAQTDYGTWNGTLQPMVANVVDATADEGARLVMVDNLYMYGRPGGPITEATPEEPHGEFSRTRKEVSDLLREAQRSGRVRLAVGRFSDYFGPGGTNTGHYHTAIAPGLRGRRMRGIVALDVPHSFHYLPDAARAFATLVEDDRADGEVWILPAAPPVTQRQLLELINAALPARVGIGVLGPLALRLASPFLSDARDLLHVEHQFAEPWVVDGRRFEEVFGRFEVTPLDEAVATTVAAFAADAALEVAA